IAAGGTPPDQGGRSRAVLRDRDARGARVLARHGRAAGDLLRRCHHRLRPPAPAMTCPRVAAIYAVLVVLVGGVLVFERDTPASEPARADPSAPNQSLL